MIVIMEDRIECFDVCARERQVWDLIQEIIMPRVAKSSKNPDFLTLSACMQIFTFIKYSRQIIVLHK